MVQYSPLDPQKSEIRLVTLLPGKSRDAIRCTLSTASLHSAPEYTALSYAWGDLSQTTPIIVDSEPFDVTVNLEAGLRAIRKRWRRRVLWIDAICINQKDVREKNVQVPQMGRLYSTAPAVLIWLGPSSPSIKAFVSWMRAHATRSHNAASAYWLVLNARAALSKNAERERDWAMVRAFEGYYDFMALSYWSRVWTFQEYLLPRIAPVCLCGNIKPFQLVTVIKKHGFDMLKNLESHAVQRLTAGYSKADGEGFAMLAEVQRRTTAKMWPGVVSGARALPSLRNDDRHSLESLVYHTAIRQCFDERDKIFALYGMVPAVQEAYPPDYTKPITTVMLQAVTYIVNFDHDSYLMWYHFGLRDERLPDASRLYPSWMPDFTQTVANISSQGNVNLHVGGRLAIPLTQLEHMPPRVSIEHSTLRLWARCLGTCKVAVRFADADSIILEQIEELLQTNMLEDIMGKSVRKPETLISRITRACVAHTSSASNFSTNEIVETFYLIFKADPDTLPNDSSGSCWSMILTAAERLRGRVLLTTEDGCFGISVGGAKDGDILVIPPELEVPLVLTPESSSSSDGIKYHEMVGTAIIDGVMKEGDLFDQELVKEIAKRDVNGRVPRTLSKYIVCTFLTAWPTGMSNVYPREIPCRRYNICAINVAIWTV